MTGMLHKTFKLAHHRHTAKHLPHHHTSYRGLFVLLAVAALSMFTIQRAAADDYAVNAVVPGSVLTNPAVITSPTDGTEVQSAIVTLQGLCQMVNTGTVVTIMRGASAIGSTACAANSRFSLSVTLVEGDNELITKVRSGAGQDGPDGVPVHLYLQIPPVTPPGNTPPVVPDTVPTNGPPAPPVAQAAPLSVQPQGDTGIQTTVGQTVTLQLRVGNGAVPFVLLTDWGDGQVEQTISTVAGELIALTHIYSTPGMHTVTVRITDVQGRSAVLEYVVYAQAAAAVTTAGGLTTAAPPTGGQFSVTKIVWLVYIVASVVVVGLWYASPTHTLFGAMHRRQTRSSKGKKKSARGTKAARRHA